ncbi:histidine kinase [Chloroflexus islandicus]|uniref:Circadian input-output histidine kinase CikA n=1 Tax=Chloroflexus islandicus TaxID=1707952 RepID=A0A178M8F9_9CHLR|nr:CHASE domain-containing protein [Chloroflexus islandicus]OAN45071.1 histidine kinase [Chloroflexus islandicus]
MIYLRRRILLGFGLGYAVLIWLSAQPVVTTRGLPLIWLAAGVALGGALLAGNRVLPVIFAGALVGYGAVFWQLGLPFERLLLSAVIFASTALGQAWLACFLVYRFGGSLPPASLPRVLRVCGLLALAVLPAPFIGVATMTAAGVRLAGDWLLAGGQWWLNFLAGVWLVTPWFVVGVYYWRQRPMREPFLWPVSSLLLALLLFSLQLIWRDAQQRYADQLQADANEIMSLIDDRLTRYEQGIQGIGAFFLASQQVEQHEFSVFVRTILNQLPALQSVGWAQRVTQAERVGFERQMQETGLPDFRVREPGAFGPPAGPRPEYFPLTYVEPFAERRPVLGMDMAVEPVRRDALAQARDSGQIVMTGPIRPYVATVDMPAVLFMAPVYNAGLPPQDIDERRRRITGMVMFLVMPAELIEQALRPVVPPDLEVLLLDVTDGAPQPLAFYASGAAQPPEQLDLAGFVSEAAMVIEQDRYGRVWQFALRPGATYPNRWLNWDVVSRTLIAVASLVIFFLFIGQRQRHDARQRRLTRTYALLSAINQMIIREREPQRIFQEVCRIAVEVGGFRMAWIGQRQTGSDRLEPVAFAGEAGDYLERLHILLSEDTTCPTAQALRSGQAMIVNNLATDERVALWREAALRLGYRASASFPLLVNGEVYATLSLYAGQPAFFDLDEVRLLNELADDVAFAIVVGRQEAQLRASEQRNHLIVSTLPDMVFRLSRQGVFIDFSAPPNTMLVQQPELFLGQPFETVLPEDLSRQLRDALEMAFATGELQTVAYQLQIDDRERFFEARIKASPAGDEAIAIVRDITAWRTAELALQAERDLLARRVAERTAELSRANAELARAVRTKDEFLANMSHELRTPLNAILALSESLLEELRGPLNERQQAAVRAIEASGRHLLALINDVLDLAKIEAGRMDISKEVVAVSDLCEASLTLVKEQAHKKQIRLSLSIDNPQTRFLADPRRIKQILVNLLSNAVKFTPDGGSVELQVTTDAAQGTIAFTVSDTGIGIAPEQMQSLFQPFVQLDSSLSRQHEGSGLGLALVRRLADLHGGSVSVTSEPGKGSIFTVTLPYQPATHAVATAIDDELSPLRVALVIVDSVTMADQLARYLEEQQIQPVLALQSSDALAHAATVRPDLIVLDLHIAGGAGWEILAGLQHDPDLRSIPVIAIVIADEAQQALAAGATAWLVQPVDRGAVRRALSQITFSPRPTTTLHLRRGLGAKLLVAEDNELNLATMSEYLKACGYELQVARNGREALAVAAEWQPDLIIMDIQMPEMDGLEAIRQLRAQAMYAATPIIAVTALAMPGDRERCLLAGATDYLAKPVSLRRLVERIEQLLQQQQHAR